MRMPGFTAELSIAASDAAYNNVYRGGSSAAGAAVSAQFCYSPHPGLFCCYWPWTGWTCHVLRQVMQ